MVTGSWLRVHGYGFMVTGLGNTLTPGSSPGERGARHPGAMQLLCLSLSFQLRADQAANPSSFCMPILILCLII